MKYIIVIFFICIILVLYIDCRNILYIDGKTDQLEQNISLSKNIFKNNGLTINDSFSLEGSLISTIPYQSPVYSMDNGSQSINNLNNKNNTQKTIEKPLATNNSNISATYSVNHYQQQQQHEQPQSSFSNAKSLLSNSKDTMSNKSSSLSDNLVSLLSGIIIESIHNGNPTFNNSSHSSTSKAKNNRDVILVSGNWNLDVQSGNVTNFSGKFLMISSNGTSIKVYNINNFKSKEKLFFGNDKSTAINGKLDFLTDNNSTKKTVQVLLTINNLELIQLTFLDKEISYQFHGFPLYGTIDSIKIKN